MVNEDGYREVLGAAGGMKENKASWIGFFQWLRGRGRSVSGCQTPVVHRPLLPQCFLCNASLQCEAGGQEAQSDPRLGEQESCP